MTPDFFTFEDRNRAENYLLHDYHQAVLARAAAESTLQAVCKTMAAMGAAVAAGTLDAHLVRCQHCGLAFYPVPTDSDPQWATCPDPNCGEPHDMAAVEVRPTETRRDAEALTAPGDE